MSANKIRHNPEYWKERAKELEEAAHKMSVKTYQEIEPAFQQAQHEIQAQIDKWYLRIADNNDISLIDAHRLLDADELEEFHWDVWQYIQKGKENEVNQKWVKELENASAKVHIQKLEALKIETQNSLENAYAIYNSRVDDMARKIYSDGFYRTAYEISKGFGIGVNVPAINHRALDNVVVKPWAADGKNFSSRIWEDKQKMVNNLHNELTRTMIRGGKPDEAISAMTQFVKKGIKNKKAAAARLVQTEEAFFHAKAALDGYSSLGVEKLEYVAALDMHTCDTCGDMDGYVFPISQAEPGVNIPPLHPRCRCVIAPYYEDDEEGERAMRNSASGKTEYVPASMKYDEWKEKYIQPAKM